MARNCGQPAVGASRHVFVWCGADLGVQSTSVIEWSDLFLNGLICSLCEAFFIRRCWKVSMHVRYVIVGVCRCVAGHEQELLGTVPADSAFTIGVYCKHIPCKQILL